VVQCGCAPGPGDGRSSFFFGHRPHRHNTQINTIPPKGQSRKWGQMRRWPCSTVSASPATSRHIDHQPHRSFSNLIPALSAYLNLRLVYLRLFPLNHPADGIPCRLPHGKTGPKLILLIRSGRRPFHSDRLIVTEYSLNFSPLTKANPTKRSTIPSDNKPATLNISAISFQKESDSSGIFCLNGTTGGPCVSAR